MKTPAYAPREPLTDRTRYARNVKKYGPAPKGWRLRQVGERYQSDDLCATNDSWYRLQSEGPIGETTYPVATPVKVSVKHDLKWRIERIEGAIGGNTEDILNLFPWAESSQGLGHWDERYKLRVRVSSDDLAYLRAVKEFMEARVKELERPAPTPSPTVPELQAKISSLEAEVASLRRKIAGAKVTFPE